MTFAFVFEGRIDTAAFVRTWRRIIAASDALTTSIRVEDGGIPQPATAAAAPETTLEDFAGRPSPLADFLAWARDRCSRPLQLDSSLVDSVLVRLDRDRYGWYLNQHHLVTDASSTVLLFRQLAAAYAAESGAQHETGAVRTLASYYPTARSLTSFHDPRIRSDAAGYWAARLAGGHRRASFYGRTATPASTRSERLELALDEPASRRLRQIAAQPGFLSLTPDISLFALFATLLSSWVHRVGAGGDVSFDAPAQNRPTPDARRALGVFIELFPFGVSVGGDDSFRTLGGKCLGETQQFLRHALPGTSGLSGTTASNVVLNVFPGAFGSFAGIPVTSDWIHSGHSDSVHAVRLQVHDYDAAGRLKLQFDLNEEAFPPALRRRAVAHFQALLNACLADPDTPIAAVDVLTNDERDTMLVRFNDTDAEPLPSGPVTAIFERQVTLTPDRIALRQGTRQVTFRQLKQQVSAVAAHAAAAGVTPGTPVAVFMRRSIEAVVAILGVLEARAAYVPIDAGYPAERVGHILRDSEAKYAFVSGGAPLPCPPEACTTIRVEDALGGTRGKAGEPGGPQLDDVAYVIYTSGSSGLPKGVPVPHGGLADYLEWAARQYVRGDRLTFPLFTSLAFDLTVTSLFLPLITGGTLVIYPEPAGPVDAAILDVVRDNAADFIKLTPSHLSLLGQLDLTGTRLQRMVVGGEAFNTHLAAKVQALVGGLEIYNEYGPTEAVVGCSVHRYDPGVDTGASVPIGRPADHVQLYVLNDALVPAPQGVPGELHVSRFGMPRGYRARRDATERAFLRHPFRPDDRLYRTGDLVRFTDGETLEYLGRLDQQIKVAGHRVEPGEIEAALLAHPAIDECFVTSRSRGRPSAPSTPRYCTRCGIASSVPDVTIDAGGVCSICRSFDEIQPSAVGYFKGMAELDGVFRESRARHPAAHDCLMLLSGGKDSSYALCRLVDMGLKVYAFTLDNGYISEQAKANIRRVVTALGVDHEFASTPAMNAIFRDSLRRFSNVCNGCFKTLYTLSLLRARERGIPIIVTGLSRGQFFETRLTESMFRSGRCSPEELDAAVLAARKAYHRVDDEVARSLDVSMFADDRIFDEVQFVDFYRYCDTGLEEILSYLHRRVPWLRPSDTGRSTNCLINDVGIYVHQKERGYHNYALPYSWDVRLGVKTRQEAIEELQDRLDESSVHRILKEIGYQEDVPAGIEQAALAAYYVASRELTVSQLRAHLADRLPAAWIPQYFVRVAALPLTPHGKVDVAALPAPRLPHTAAGTDAAPATPAQRRIAAIWRDVLRVDHAGIETSFFELGGTSLNAMETIIRICDEFQIDLPLQTIFRHPTILALEQAVEARILDEIAGLSDEEAERLADGLS
jgi:amino acid adenylation domain-containing protein